MGDWFHSKKIGSDEFGSKTIDERGNKYKSFIVIEPIKKNGIVYWKCKCEDCGYERLIQATKLRNGRFSLCDCDSKHGRNYPRNHEGEHHYMWTIMERVYNGKKPVHHRCVCDCGNERVIAINTIIQGKSKSCGCVGFHNIKEYIINVKKQPYNIAAFEELYNRYLNNAQKRGMVFHLSKEEFGILIKDNCFYCGSEPNTNHNLKRRSEVDNTYLYNGIDRIDNSKGYTVDNAVTCCKKCNLMKHVLTKEEFIIQAKKITDNQKNK